MRVYTGIVHDDLADVSRAAADAEARGYDGVLSMENNHEPFMPLAVAALATDRIALATSVAIAFARSPTVTAHTAWDLQVASRGRFALGLGTQVKGHNERRFGVAWSPPAPRLAEYVRVVRAIWACWEHGEPVVFHGKHYRVDLMPPNFRPPASGLDPIPITVAAVGPAMLRLAGRLCDGVRLHPFCTRAYLDNVVWKEVASGLAASGLAREHFEVSGGGFVATGPDEESVAKALEFVRYRVAFYGSTRTYFPVWAEHDLEDLGEELHRLSVAGRWDEMASRISDDVVRLFAAVGAHDVIAGEIERRFGGASDAIGETLLPGQEPSLPPGMLQDLHRIPAAFTGFRTD